MSVTDELRFIRTFSTEHNEKCDVCFNVLRGNQIPDRIHRILILII